MPPRIPPAVEERFAGSLTPLPESLARGLIPVAVLGFLSFLSTLTLLVLLTYRIITWQRKSRHINQFVILIYNLLCADLQQSIAFVLNARWLVKDSIEVGTATCWAQGWFVSTGDMGSGAFCFAIGLHTFATVLFDYRLSTKSFLLTIIAIWLFIYGTAVAGVAQHPQLYVRAVSWCWVNAKYQKIRLWLHYFWIILFEFGTAFIYIALYICVRSRLQGNFYASKTQARHARKAAKLMVVYPVVYVVCTLPLVTLRLYSMGGHERYPKYTFFCLAGGMITSNGWLDVILYSITRRIMLFSDEPPPDTGGLETFRVPWGGKDPFGTETRCEYVPDSPEGEVIFFVDKSYGGMPGTLDDRGAGLAINSPDPLGFVNIKQHTTVEVRSHPMTEEEKAAAKRRRESPTVPGLAVPDETGSTHRLWTGKEGEEGGASPASLEFGTKPVGY
ncbi:hypothetical protein EJ06DRAFT_426026 [Trichodelitschia bisporula]|uniref:G-protein coupled receptors family 1 profile domain-containing protein n=1 Tax=Trichodelitschia bisporula TaxID=703511 RepID=A0A6G1HWS4_9PEZI|nr:hypothetical protein EJ06DRAFT_426026 [Trichodelitschia bisporula]